ncbi:hypothetical protein E1B28_007180 [Marasmius oreades]|uniref:Uncharacterized protein n=1 Tax=Marasmius oreades TaxID=181124 RepID=A0A9P7S1T8_9AGAR|nr:uncharacterized protein E1B28_007180 [Marasmius oreades]KAG7093505.1 hypothetical protein E1B28_007180 [Marasmius oreades]
MGQRFQAYVIARINSTYRCIAGWHNQWCWGALPAQAARRFIDLVKVKSNADIIREELKAFSLDKTDSDDHPCPFINFLLAVAINTNLEGEIFSSMSGAMFQNALIPASSDPWSEDNDEGFAVFDVTDPQNPAYCLSSEDMCTAPLSAEDYTLQNRHNERLDEETVAFFRQVKMIEPYVLEEVWGFESGCDQPALEGSEHTLARTIVPSLTDLALEPAIDQAVVCDDPDPLERFIWLPEKASLIMKILRTRCYASLGPATMAFISKVVQANPSDIDLSYLSLSSDDIVQVLSCLERSQTIHCLNLSHNEHVSTNTLHVVLKAHPNIRRIVLYGTSISDEDLDSLLYSERCLFYGVEEVIHPALFSFGSSRRKSRRPAFSFWSAPGLSRTSVTASLPLLNPTLILQSISILLKAWIHVIRENEFGDGWTLSESQTTCWSAFSGGLRGKDQRWGERAIIQCPFPSPRMFFEGWMFVLDSSKLFGFEGILKYGFIRPKSKVYDQAQDVLPEYEIHELDSFLTELKAEGYPEALASVVDEMRVLLIRLKETILELKLDDARLTGVKETLTLFTEETIKECIGRCKSSLQLFR